MPAMPVKLLILTLCFLSICFSSAAAQGSPNQVYGTILGTVVDPMGVGIPGVRITMIEDLSNRNTDVTTDCSGLYRLLDLPTGSYTVRFGKQAFRVETRTSVLISPYAVTQLDVKMQLGQFVDGSVIEVVDGPIIETRSGPSWIGSITGTVTDGGRAPIPGAHVKAIDEKTGYAAETTTNANGLYRFSGIERGTYSVTVEAQGFKTENKRSVLVGAEASVDIRLSVGGGSSVEVIADPVAEKNRRRTETGPTGAIQGTVIAATGAVPTRISAVDEATRKRYETTTDSNGAYRFHDLPAGTYCAKFEAAGPRFEANWPGYETSKEVKVESHRVSELNVTIPASREIVVLCSASCMFYTIQLALPEPAERRIALQVYAASNFAKAGSELWVTVTLANTSKHSVFIREERGPRPAVDYQVYAFGTCNCPGLLQVAREPGRWRDVRVKPGGTVVERVDLSKLMNFDTPGTYTIMVGYKEDSGGSAVEEVKYQPFVRSNPITVTLTADTR
jgi:hypothetical protein